MSTLAERLIAALAADPSKSKAGLARACDVSKPAVTGWFQGGGLDAENLIPAAKYLNVTPEWLMTGRGQMDAGSRAASNVAPAYPTGYRRLPVVSWVSAGGWGSAADPFMPGDADEWKETFRKVGDSAFMLRVRGDSMTNPHGFPSAPEGSLIVVDPSVRAENGNLVVAKLDNSEEATFKKLVIDSGRHYLKALNPDYKPIQVNGNCRIIGVVVQVVLEL